MRSLFGNRRLILAFAVLALGALTILATSLEEVPFHEAQRFGREETEESEPAPGFLMQEWQQASPGDDFLVWTLIGVLVAMIGLIVSPELRRQMFKMFLRVAFTAATILFLVRMYGDRLFGEEVPTGEGGPPAGGIAPSTTPVFEPPEPSSGFSYLISFAVALLFVALIWWIYRSWQKRSLSKTTQSLDDIAKIARSSLQELSSGRNSSDVIINCYLRMSDVVSDRRRLQRADAMTPNEFALRLEQAGLPGEAVKRLTRLFELVRYGDRKSGPGEVNEAVSCLQTILQYCGEPV